MLFENSHTHRSVTGTTHVPDDAADTHSVELSGERCVCGAAPHFYDQEENLSSKRP